jgi:hypothetical protein
MKEQLFLIVDSIGEVNEYLIKGWEIISVTAQQVSNNSSLIKYGKFAIVIQKQK